MKTMLLAAATIAATLAVVASCTTAELDRFSFRRPAIESVDLPTAVTHSTVFDAPMSGNRYPLAVDPPIAPAVITPGPVAVIPTITRFPTTAADIAPAVHRLVEPADFAPTFVIAPDEWAK